MAGFKVSLLASPHFMKHIARMAEEKGKKASSIPPKQRFERMVDDAIRISGRFAREPVFGPTGKGYYRSVGVEGLREDEAILNDLPEDEQSR